MWVKKFLCFLAAVSVGRSANILGVFLTPSYSHQIVYQPIWKELSLRGHNVTVYTPNPLNDESLTNLTEYDMSFSYEVARGFEMIGNSGSKLAEIFEAFADIQLSHPYMKDLIKNVNNETYDLFLVEYIWPSMYAFKDVYKVPMIGISSMPLTVMGTDSLGLEKHPVLDPHILLPFSYAETFKDRAVSWMYTWLYRINVETKLTSLLNKQVQRHFGDIGKDLFDLMKEVSLVLVNSNHAIQSVKPLTPNYIPISALHVQPPKSLPTDLSNFLDNIKNNAIYFSLGTNVKYSSGLKDSLDKLINVLGRVPYTIIWKVDPDSPPEKLPKNFYVRKWFPQQDILAHPKIKLFITQGGLQSIDEAISRKVPMLVLPIHSDQKGNADRCVRLGIAESTDYLLMNEEELENKLNKLLTNSTYKRNIEKQSKIVSDQPLSSLETAIYWIEYVIRHDGAPHLRYKAVDLPFYQYYMLDVYLLVAVVLAILYRIGKRSVAIVILTCRVLKRLILSKLLTTEKVREKKSKIKSS